jgi:uncharacterized protein
VLLFRRRVIPTLGLLCVLMIPSLKAFAFDCAKASTRVEKLICSEEKLVQLDRELNRLYKEASKREPQGIRDEQRQWLKSRNSCVDAACVLAAYEDRVDELNSFIRAWDKDVAAATRIEKEERSAVQRFTPDSKQKDILSLMHRGALCAGFYSRYLPGSSRASCDQEGMDSTLKCWAWFSRQRYLGWQEYDKMLSQGWPEPFINHIKTLKGEFSSAHATGVRNSESGDNKTAHICRAYIDSFTR